MDQPHIYEDPESMLPPPCDITLVPRDYRESPVTPSMSTGTKSGVSQQKLGRECTAKPSKKWNIKLRGKKSKKGSGESSRNQGGVTEGERDTKKASSDINLKKGQVKSNNRNRGGVSTSTLQRGWDSADIAQHLTDDDSSPPPTLPTRGYLMDEEFTVELNALEKQLADVGMESEDEYTTMGNVQYTAEEDEPYTPPVPKRHYTLSNTDAEKSLIPPRHCAPSIPERSYENFTDTQESQTPPIPKRHYTRSDNSAEKSHPMIPKRQYVEDAPSILARSYENFTNVIPQGYECHVPTVPKRSHTRSDSSAHHPLIPKRQYIGDVSSIPPRSYENFTTANPQECTRTVPKRLHTQSDTSAEKPNHPLISKRQYVENAPLIPDRSYENFTDESCASEACYINESTEGLFINEGDEDPYINEDDEGQYIIERDESLYINRDNIPAGTDRSRETSRGHNSESEGEYDYVLSDAVRCMRRMMGRKTGRRTK